MAIVDERINPNSHGLSQPRSSRGLRQALCQRLGLSEHASLNQIFRDALVALGAGGHAGGQQVQPMHETEVDADRPKRKRGRPRKFPV